MRVLNILVTGGIGGIEILCNNIDKSKKIDNYWCFLLDDGKIANEIYERSPNNIFILKNDKKRIFKQTKEIINICNKNKIDIIALHPGGMYGNIIYTLVKKRLPNLKYVRFLHSCYEKKYYLKGNYLKKKVNYYFLDQALKCSNLIISVSNAVEKSFLENFNIDKIAKKVIYNGIGNEFFEKEVLVNSKFKGNIIRIVYIGRLSKVKGVDVLLEAISMLIKEKVNVQLTIVGDGKEKQYLENLASNLAIKDMVNFVGTQTNVIEWLDKADIFVYPVIWQEAFGISVVEAMSRGCIPIVTKKGGLPEIIDDEVNGFIISKCDREELAQKIANIMRMQNKEWIIKNAIKKSYEFQICKTINRLQEIYKELLNN